LDSWKHVYILYVLTYFVAFTYQLSLSPPSLFLSVSLSHCCVVVVLAPTKRKKITSWKRMKILSQY